MPSKVFNENAAFISAVMLINTAHVSGFVIFPDDLRFLALLPLPDKLESNSATFAAWAAASSAASASASACSSSACFSAAILSISAASSAAATRAASKSATCSASLAKASSSSFLALFNSSTFAPAAVVLTAGDRDGGFVKLAVVLKAVDG